MLDSSLLLNLEYEGQWRAGYRHHKPAPGRAPWPHAASVHLLCCSEQILPLESGGASSIKSNGLVWGIRSPREVRKPGEKPEEERRITVGSGKFSRASGSQLSPKR